MFLPFSVQESRETSSSLFGMREGLFEIFSGSLPLFLFEDVSVKFSIIFLIVDCFGCLHPILTVNMCLLHFRVG